MDHKQTSALYRGGSLAQRTEADGHGPEADAPDEITSAAPPDDRTMKEKGRASSPNYDETPVSGKVKGDPTAQKPGAQSIKAGDAPEHKGVEKITDIEDLPPNTDILIRGNEVVLHVRVNSGMPRTFHGKTFAEALAAFNKFNVEGPETFASGLTKDEQKQKDTQIKQANDEAHKRALEAEKDKK